MRQDVVHLTRQALALGEDRSFGLGMATLLQLHEQLFRAVLAFAEAPSEEGDYVERESPELVEDDRGDRPATSEHANEGLANKGSYHHGGAERPRTTERCGHDREEDSEEPRAVRLQPHERHGASHKGPNGRRLGRHCVLRRTLAADEPDGDPHQAEEDAEVVTAKAGTWGREGTGHLDQCEEPEAEQPKMPHSCLLVQARVLQRWGGRRAFRAHRTKRTPPW